MFRRYNTNEAKKNSCDSAKLFTALGNAIGSPGKFWLFPRSQYPNRINRLPPAKSIQSRRLILRVFRGCRAICLVTEG